MAHLAAHRAQRKPPEDAAAARAHHQQAGAAGSVDGLGGWRARDQPHGDRRHRPAQAARRVVHQRLHFPGPLVQAQVALRIGDRRAVTHAEDGERGMVRRGLVHGPQQGPLRIRRAVHPDDDPRHRVSSSRIHHATMYPPRHHDAIPPQAARSGIAQAGVKDRQPSLHRSKETANAFGQVTARLRRSCPEP
jgi:hypothetical protein